MGGEAVVHPKILVSVRGRGGGIMRSLLPFLLGNITLSAAQQLRKSPKRMDGGSSLHGNVGFSSWKCGGFLLPCKAAV